jgi:hypothetical protein
MRRAESKTAVDQVLATFCHLCVALDLIFKLSLPVEGRLMKERNTRERKGCRIAAAAAHTANVLDTPGAKIGLPHCSV